MSDGKLSPEALADYLADAGVAWASLTDHDTTAGSARFREALLRRGVGCIEGIEYSATSSLGLVHILAYGASSTFIEFTASTRPSHPGQGGELPAAADLIRAIREAGGAAFLAHPLTVSRDASVLDTLLSELQAAGLAGIEAIYGPYTASERGTLLDLAARHGLATCAGSDFHEPGVPGQGASIGMGEAQWEAFRALLLRQVSAPSSSGSPRDPRRASPALALPEVRGFAARIVAPAFVALSLCLTAFFLIEVPQFSSMLLERKKEMIRELTRSASSILQDYARDVDAGRLGLADAQKGAAERIRNIRYGREGKDYFWITDSLPRMVMHPYRTDLEGADLRGYKDRNGLRVFVEFVKAVKEKSEGYVEYLWQWEDDASRIVPKLSYVSRFAPWDWIIGTGVYLDDVTAETRTLSGRLVALSAGVSLVLALVLAFMVFQSLGLERARLLAERAIHESRERYRALVEASTEGMVIVSGGACSHANSCFIEMTGYSETELQLLGVRQLFIPFAENDEKAASFLSALSEGKEDPSRLPPPFECSLRRRGKEPLEIVLTSSALSLAGKDGIILAARDVGARFETPGSAKPDESRALAAGIGSFGTRWNRRAVFLEASGDARRLFGIPEKADLEQIGLFSLIPDHAEGERLYALLSSEGTVSRVPLRVGRRGSPLREIVLTAFLSGRDGQAADRIMGIIEDVSMTLRKERAMKTRLAGDGAAMLFLTAPVSGIASMPQACGMAMTVAEAAASMRRHSASELIVEGPDGAAIGIITLGDMAERLFPEGLDGSTSVATIMSSPLRSIAPTRSLGEALETLLSARIGRLALRNPGGPISGIVRGQDILSALGASILSSREAITAASSVDDLQDLMANSLVGLGSLLAAGARPRYVARLFTKLHDALAARLVEFAIGELGEPPCTFAFVVLGSAGRFELLPGSDQDNAIVYLPLSKDGEAERAWFLALGASVCHALSEFGVPLCKGGIMAMNPSCCASLAEWRSRFAHWISEPEPDKLLDINAFFDMRAIAGDLEIADTLRESVVELLGARPDFFIHLAHGTGRVKLPSSPPRNAGELKEAAALFSNFARAYALKEGLAEQNTFERLEELAALGILRDDTCRDSGEAFELLLGMRLALGLASGHPSQVKSPSQREETELKRVLAQAVIIQKRIGFDFLGSAL